MSNNTVTEALKTIHRIASEAVAAMDAGYIPTRASLADISDLAGIAIRISSPEPPAEPSGNTGELPVCATCGGKKRVMRATSVRSDADADLAELQFRDCPDCSAAQPGESK